MVKSTIVPGASLRVVVDALNSLLVTVSKKHIRGAKRCNGKECLVAQAMMDSNVGEFCDGVEIGLSVTKISIPGKILRYATPKALIPHIKHFDRHGVWNLPEGDYVFKPLSRSMRLGGRPNRWTEHREGTDGSGRDGKMRAVPSRTITIDRNKK